jgi:hypothetical protein
MLAPCRYASLAGAVRTSLTRCTAPTFSYKPNFFFWDCCEMLRKAFICGLM